MDIDNRMAAGMAEATRLTREGRLRQAAAIIQDTLRGMHTKYASSNATACTDDEPIDVSFRVIDETPPPTQVSPPQRAYPMSSSAVTTPRPPEVALRPPSPGSASAELTESREEQAQRRIFEQPHRSSERASRSHARATQMDGSLSSEWTWSAPLPSPIGPGTSRYLGRRTIYRRLLYEPCWDPCLQALRPQWIYRASLTVGGHAPWMHAGPRRFRRGYSDECPCRTGPVLRRLSPTSTLRKSIEMLELVPGDRSAAWAWRTFHHCRAYQGDHSCLPPQHPARVCGRAISRRGDGRHLGNHLP